MSIQAPVRRPAWLAGHRFPGAVMAGRPALMSARKSVLARGPDCVRHVLAPCFRGSQRGAVVTLIGVNARGADAVSATVLPPFDSPTFAWGFFDVQLGSLDVGLLKAAE